MHYNGQPIGVVVADTFEHAMAAARLVTVRYDRRNAGARHRHRAEESAGARSSRSAARATYKRGDVDAGLREAAVRVDQTYTTPLENHNPMEVHNTIASWEGDKLTLYDSTQGIFSVRNTRREDVRPPPDNVRVVSYFTGGGFGSKGGPWSHEMLAAMAAKQVERPVKLVLTRRQMFGPVGGRAAHDSTRHTRRGEATVRSPRCATRACRTRRRSRIGSSPRRQPDAHALRVRRISRRSTISCGSTSARRRSCARRANRRGTFALESAMDELAYALGHGSRRAAPEELRGDAIRRAAQPWSSKSLRECYRARRREVRLAQAQSEAALDARRTLARRLRHGDGDVSRRGASRPARPRG